MPPYQLGPLLWPLAVLLLLILTPKRVGQAVARLLRILGLAIAVLLLLPYLFS
ncbi:hypothetical protein RMN57_13130 [Kitasatospora sp. CM 4170]|uniref:Uncharacterized protein n=1 Tax=Kitasatospora aburaviensis TaxID=67265 RepID=A0ABW1F3I5_9ACTN|nr:hypothetical protein [Kitasatospora sp. CM 4170]WNM45597.1 hypothetical protein RMN57_13130 [Kitasatospora sp. CM 4170]